jgi:hypothetical protein
MLSGTHWNGALRKTLLAQSLATPSIGVYQLILCHGQGCSPR